MVATWLAGKRIKEVLSRNCSLQFHFWRVQSRRSAFSYVPVPQRNALHPINRSTGTWHRSTSHPPTACRISCGATQRPDMASGLRALGAAHLYVAPLPRHLHGVIGSGAARGTARFASAQCPGAPCPPTAPPSYLPRATPPRPFAPCAIACLPAFLRPCRPAVPHPPPPSPPVLCVVLKARPTSPSTSAQPLDLSLLAPAPSVTLHTPPRPPVVVHLPPPHCPSPTAYLQPPTA